MKLGFRYAVLGCVAVLHGALLNASAPGQADDLPALVVVVSVDQWRYDYFERFRAHLSPRGVAKRTQATGAWFENCLHQHAFTFTGPGHSVLLTGAYPSRTGIIGNDWFEPSANMEQYCILDPDATIIGSTSVETLVSPKRLLVDTVGDQLKLASGGKSKVFGVAIKDRASVLMSGHMADAAYWMSTDGKWVTSSHYRHTLPGYLRILNEQGAINRYAGQAWTLLLDPVEYVHGSSEQSKYERPKNGMTKDFPHIMPAIDYEFYVENVACSPFGNDATLEAARAVVEYENLGVDEHPDLLVLNISSTDYVGHSFGPYSLEVEDMTYRTDIALGEFAAFLDETLDRPWVMFLTADHGVAPIPEHSSELKLVAKRDPLGVPSATGNIELLRQQLEAVLRDRLHIDPSDQNVVQAALSNQVYLNRDHPALDAKTAELARHLLRDWLQRYEVVAYAATREQLQQDDLANDIHRMMKRSYHPQRSGDVLYVLAPFCFTNDAATTHGSPWQYNRHVPLMVLGSRPITRSTTRNAQEVSPASIAPTISNWLKVEAPSACMERSLPVMFSSGERLNRANARR